MKSINQTGTMQNAGRHIRALINRVAQIFSQHYEPIPQQLTHVTERFDVVRKLPYRGWILGPDNR